MSTGTNGFGRTKKFESFGWWGAGLYAVGQLSAVHQSKRAATAQNADEKALFQTSATQSSNMSLVGAGLFSYAAYGAGYKKTAFLIWGIPMLVSAFQGISVVKRGTESIRQTARAKLSTALPPPPLPPPPPPVQAGWWGGEHRRWEHEHGQHPWWG